MADFDVLTAFAELAEPLAPFIARIRVALAEAEPIDAPETYALQDCLAIRAEGEAIMAEAGTEGLSFALATITSESGDRAEAFEALIQRSWSDLPGWGAL